MQSTTLLVHLVFESIVEKVGNKLTPVHTLHVFQIRLHHTKFQGKKVCRVRNQNGRNATKTLAVASMDHSPGWGNICCLGEEKWSARKQLR